MFKIRVDSAIHRYGLIVEGECYILGCVIFLFCEKISQLRHLRINVLSSDKLPYFDSYS